MLISNLLVKAALVAGAVGLTTKGLTSNTRVEINSDKEISPLELPVGNGNDKKWNDIKMGDLIDHETLKTSSNNLPPHDCEDILKRNIVPQIDCSYSWENCRFDNHLSYKIRISPVGKSSDKWCEILNNAVMRNINYMTGWEGCNRQYKVDPKGNGIWLNVTLPKPDGWKQDWRFEVQKAISESMCPGHPELTYWVNKGCYRSSICRSRSRKRDDSEIFNGHLPELEYEKEHSESEIATDTTNTSVATVTVTSNIPATTTFFQDEAKFETATSIESTVTTVVTSATVPKINQARNEPATTTQTIKLPEHVENGLENLNAAQNCPSQEQICSTAVNLRSVSVHCSYVWDQGKEHSLLNYKVAINPTGQDTRCWCRRIINAVRERCPSGENERTYPIFQCNEKHIRNALGFGMFINFYANRWVKEEDNRRCIKAAIDSTTCGIRTFFDKGGCFKSK
ncbi:hypothetical protein CCHL11_02319 [Colletotrichum chlorophyti]|uniref:Uncharacterized protein n=1 Tax=Colletotrichum chlorophyti TaxID=708187 RepID=A0A1Q8S661_9PEZI|nr:hypothetical protein CCHL11_02319 [Colletotrichum chlorophyti]